MSLPARNLDYRLINFVLAALGGAIAVYVAVAVPQPHIPGAPMAILMSPSPIQVYVTGAVQKPGLYRLTSDARYDAAIQAAGGLTSSAAAATVNLARRVRDEEMVVVPAQGQPPPTVTEPTDDEIASSPTEPDSVQSPRRHRKSKHRRRRKMASESP